jgi:hypothetical protein
MAGAKNKTQAGDGSVETFVAAIADDRQRQDAEALIALFSEVTGEPAVMWAGNIIGFGKYHYRYASGREDDSFPAGFAPRAKEMVVYLAGMNEGRADLLSRLGKHRLGKSCIYIKRIADVDQAVLKEMVQDALAFVRTTYPDQP